MTVSRAEQNAVYTRQFKKLMNEFKIENTKHLVIDQSKLMDIPRRMIYLILSPFFNLPYVELTLGVYFVPSHSLSSIMYSLLELYQSIKY